MPGTNPKVGKGNIKPTNTLKTAYKKQRDFHRRSILAMTAKSYTGSFSESEPEYLWNIYEPHGKNSDAVFFTPVESI